MTQFDVFYESTGISTDSRSDVSNKLFICIRGENFDGNSFSAEALSRGAHHVIVDNPVYFTDPEKMTLVQNSVKYLQDLANFHRNKFKIPVIGITGSNGKTTTKELIRTVLSKKYNVLSTEGNLNNHLGVPFTLLNLTNEHEIAIIEMGANRFKDIEELCTIAEPNFGIITNIGKAHLEGFLNFEGVLKTKRELYTAIAKVDGTIVVNADDPVLTSILPDNTTNFTYGTDMEADIVGSLTRLDPYVVMTWKQKDYSSDVIRTQMVGEYNFYNYLAAVAFGIQFGVDHGKISEAITEYTPSNRRSQVKDTFDNTLILDCYNANPTSMRSALISFAKNTSDLDKLIILGDMKELGNDTIEEHQKVLQLTEELGLKGYFVGPVFYSLNSESMIDTFENTDDLLVFLMKHHVKNKIILIKGSRSIGLEETENYL